MTPSFPITARVTAPSLLGRNIAEGIRLATRVASARSNATWEVRTSFLFLYSAPGADIIVGVDNPRPPPCIRCRRESKRCEFSATRRKRKASDAEPDAPGPLRRDKRMMVGEASYTESPSIGSNGSPIAPPPSASYDNEKPSSSPATSSRMPHTAPKEQYSPNSSPTSHFSETRNGRPGSYSVQARSAGLGYSLESRQHVMNKTAADLLSPTISNSHDALHLLSEAAGRTEDLNRQSLENRARQSASSFGSQMSPAAQAGMPGGRHSLSKPPRSTPADGYFHVNGSDYRDNSVSSADRPDPGYLDAVKAWSRLRFVRAGWLTVEEAMAYIA
jgi:hypothetical protein